MGCGSRARRSGSRDLLATRDSRGRWQACVEVASPGPIGVLKPDADDIDDADAKG